MIKEFVEKYMENKHLLEEIYKKGHPADYKEVVKNVIEILGDEDNHVSMDPKRIHEIDDGDYQGTLIYVIGATNYQPSDYWYVRVYYGSCSGCDQLESIKDYSYELPNEQQVKDYMTLSLHVVQQLKSMSPDIV